MLREESKKAWSYVFVTQALLAKKIDEAMQEAGVISLDVYDVLLNLEISSGQMLKMSELAETVVLSRSGLTRLVDRLENCGFIERHSCPSDGRAVYAKLTPLGLKERERAWKIFEVQIENLFEKNLKPEDDKKLVEIFGRILKPMNHRFGNEIS